MEKMPYWEYLKPARQKLGLSIETLSEGVCSVSYLSLIENGKRPLTMQIWRQLKPRIGDQIETELNFDEMWVFDELTTAVRLLQQPSEQLSMLFRASLIDFIRQAIASESRGDLLRAKETYRQLFSLAMSSELEWNEVCGNANWEFQMRVFVAEQLCRLEADTNSLDSAVSVAEQMIRIATERDLSRTDEIRSLKSLLIGIESELGKFESSDRHLNELDFTAESDRDRAINLWLRGQLLLDRGKTVESAFVLRSATELLQGHALKATQFRLTNAAVWSECLADTQLSPTAFEDLSQAVGFFRSSGNIPDLASCLNTLSFLAMRLGLFEFAENSRSECLSLADAIAGPRKARLICGIALVDISLGHVERALEQLRVAQKILVGSDHGRTTAKIWAQMADIYEKIGDTTTSLECMKLSLESMGVSGKPMSIARENLVITQN